MLTAQYAIVMIVVILTIAITKQMYMVKSIQLGGNNPNILVLKEQSEPVKERYDILKSELMKHIEIKSVTSSFQIPGDAIRDGIAVSRAEHVDWKMMPVMVVGEDFFPFFNIHPQTGKIFSPSKFSYQEDFIVLAKLAFGCGKSSGVVKDRIDNNNKVIDKKSSLIDWLTCKIKNRILVVFE